MATTRACKGLVKIEDPATPGTFLTVAQVTSWSEEPNISAEEKRYIRENCNPVNTVNGISYNLTLELDTDYEDAAQASLANGEIVTVVIYPEGSDTGNRERTYEGGYITISESATAGEIITSSVTVTGCSRTEVLVP